MSYADAMNRRKTSAVLTGVLALAWTWIGAGQSTKSPSGAVTFSEHVAPIIYKRCTTCHRLGEVAPFELKTYDDVARRGKTIAAVTRARIMPPWKAEGDYAFDGDRRLTDKEIDTLQRWVEGGMPQGDPKKMPKAPSFPDGWALGKPDVVVTMPEAFPLPAGGRDVYRNFVIPLNNNTDRWVRAAEYRPSARKAVHHAIFYLDATGAARQQDAEDPVPGFNGLMGPSLPGGRASPADLIASALGNRATRAPAAAERTGGSLGGWAPGGGPSTLPEGMAFFLPKGSDLIISTHFHLTGKPEQEATTFGIYFASQPPSKPFFQIQLPPRGGIFKGINIPPGEARYMMTDSFILPTEVKAFGIAAHAHYLGKEIKLTATLPNGKVKTLISIPDWDLNWQGRYTFKEYITLPAGTRLDATLRYDNSAANFRNPSNPPRRVTFGEQSTDEMGGVILSVMPANPGVLNQLRNAYDKHVQEAVLASPQVRRGQR